MTSHYSQTYSQVPNLRPFRRLYPEFISNFLSFHTSPLRQSSTPPIVFNSETSITLSSNTVPCETQKDCENLVVRIAAATGPAVNRDLICLQGKCVAGNSNYHTALPMGFIIDESEGDIIVGNSSLGLWAESRSAPPSFMHILNILTPFFPLTLSQMVCSLL